MATRRKKDKNAKETPTARRGPGAPKKPDKVKKVRTTYHLPEELIEQARDAVYWLSGPPLRLTLTRLVETALRRELELLKKKHNGGRDFEQRKEDLVGGRPIGT